MTIITVCGINNKSAANQCGLRRIESPFCKSYVEARRAALYIILYYINNGSILMQFYYPVSLQNKTKTTFDANIQTIFSGTLCIIMLITSKKK